MALNSTVIKRLSSIVGVGGVLLLVAAIGCSSASGDEPRIAEPPCGGQIGRGPSYSTAFGSDELPISENGAWTHRGRPWTMVQTENGSAHGTQTGRGGYDDSYAYLSGFPPDQQACGVIQKGSPTGFQEVEILLRWSDDADNARGYECFIHHGGQYAKIVRWNGPYGDFTTLAEVGDVIAPQNGDTIRATAAGNVITLYLNDRLLTRAVDSVYPTGNPGIGFFKDERGAANGEFGLASFTATGL